MKTYYHIMMKTPHLSGKAREYSMGYRKIALVEATTETPPAMIADRARGMVRVISCRSLYFGRGVRSEGAAYLAALKDKKKRLEEMATL